MAVEMTQAELIGAWATGMWMDAGMPSAVASSTISGYAVQPNTLGRLSNLTSTCYVGSGFTGMGTTNYQATPPLQDPELAIIGQMFLVGYYNGLAFAAMGQGGDALPWTTLREEGSTISRVNAASLGKEYREMSKTANEQLNYLVNAYRSSVGGNIPRSVDFFNIAGPIWGGSYLGP